jgi:hypothetical protein
MPATSPSVVTPALERDPRRPRQVRRPLPRDLPPRVQPVQVRNVPVMGLRLVEILDPFLQLPVPSTWCGGSFPVPPRADPEAPRPPQSRPASMQFVNSSRTICVSIVGP